MNNNNLNPNYVSGFVDGEVFSCFYSRQSGTKSRKKCPGSISLHKKDKALLDLIRNYFLFFLPRWFLCNKNFGKKKFFYYYVI
jgi:hypothetical protein